MKIAFTGDFSFTRYFKDAFNKENLFSNDIIDFLCDADENVVNVEGTFTNIDKSNGDLFFHYSNPEGIKWLNKINGTIWNLANNHVVDCGLKGITDTIDYARQNNVKTIGADINKDKAKDVLILNELVGFVSIVYDATDVDLKATDSKFGCILWNDFNTIKNQIKLVKSKCKYCIVIPHCGHEFAKMPLPFVRNIYKKYLKFGADIIVAHHPHVVQNYERFNDKLVFYSLGNFLFDTDYQRAHKYTDEGILLKLNIPENNDKISFEYMPIKIDRENCVVVKNDKSPAIFSEINSKDYRKLWTAGAYNLYEEKILLEKYLLKTKNQQFDEKAWVEYKLKEKCNEYGKQLYKELIKGTNLFIKHGVKTEKKEVLNYIIDSSKI